ncbi:MAG: energy transducer TonB [Bacteroidota bacterium]
MRILISLGFAFALHASSLFAQMPFELVHIAIEEAYSAPSYSGGSDALATYIHDRLQYPELAVDYSIEGTVVLRLTIDKAGQIANTEVVQSLGFGCEEAAKNAIDGMPGWQAARRGNRAEESIVLLPIRFRLR